MKSGARRREGKGLWNPAFFGQINKTTMHVDSLETLGRASGLPRVPGLVLTSWETEMNRNTAPTRRAPRACARLKDEGPGIPDTASAEVGRGPGSRGTRPPGVRGGVGRERARAGGRGNETRPRPHHSKPQMPSWDSPLATGEPRTGLPGGSGAVRDRLRIAGGWKSGEIAG